MVTPMSDTKPTVTIPDTEPPAELVIDDLVVGDGAEATKGANVIVHYVGVAWSNGQQFDASWDRNDPFEFRLGAGQVISGWDEGVAGMKIGGRRQLTIPPHLGYGAQGAGGVIKGGETRLRRRPAQPRLIAAGPPALDPGQSGAIRPEFQYLWLS